mmetsp:Transcript_14858/g.42057  ORF Transcript_14858/g.42057 Transcript_14858/m.42057 type:complete len:265 (-) Transcript_14858:260-1054(-)
MLLLNCVLCNLSLSLVSLYFPYTCLMPAESFSTVSLASPSSMSVLSFKKTGLSTPAYPAANDRFITITCFEFQTRKTGMPAIWELGSSSAAELTVSFAPITNVKSVSSKSSLISSISSTISYGTPASARRTLSCPGMRPATGWMANRTFLPAFIKVSAISFNGYWACATANPYPGTTMMLSLSASSFTVSSMFVIVASPSNFMASPPPVPFVPNPPKMTETMSRFMASHMIFVKAAPEHPINAPTVVKSGMSSMKPSAHSAQPE